MPDSILNRLFGCSHKRTTMPMSAVTKPGAPAGQLYVVCLDCGGKFAYDWKEMRRGERIGTPAAESKGWLARLLGRET